jgi:uncharacterized membrane protein YdbT with pleckstrin-like domain
MTEPQPSQRIPIPDPTALTIDLLRREISSLQAILEARMDAMDQARGLLLQIMTERGAETERRFHDRDIRFDERDKARTDAVRTALQSARDLSDARDAATDKAGEKFEASVREQITQLSVLAAANRDQLSTQIDALKERIDRGEGGQAGAKDLRSESRLNLNAVVSAAAVLIALVSFILYVTKK